MKKRTDKNTAPTIDPRIEVKYTWIPKTKDPREINSVTMLQMHVPRVDEFVDINVQVGPKEWAKITGRVRDVLWWVKTTGTTAEVEIRWRN